ncbi:MAG: hypothetical protein K0R94_707 [Burkholderiales bacterium]|jgi:hypothetical protein|nr:hypothetical protein [Burkholderiales bacterium]
MKRIILLAIITLLGLTACGGGGGGSSNAPIPTPPAPVTLSPLKIALLDLNDNPVPYADISKIGSHAVYKLKFTNINNIKIYLGFDAPEYDLYAQAQKMGMTIESYIYNYLPSGAQYGAAVKNNNFDNCFNYIESGASTVTLESGASCSYYTYFANMSNNNSNKDTFTVPVSYTIRGHDDASVGLDVVQCTGSDASSNYDCSNMTKPGFSEQFITYKALPINGTSNLLPFNPFGGVISQDGNWYWSCTTGTCNKYALNYDNVANILTQAAKPTIINIFNSYRNIEMLYPSLDGSNVWVTSFTNKKGFALVNTDNPDVMYDDNCPSSHCVPDIDSSLNLAANGVIGLDGSFWWDTGVMSDIYDPKTQSFIKTNITGVSGVNADGTVIGVYNGKTSCFDRGPDYTSYIYRGPLLNFSQTVEGTVAINYQQNVYLLMDLHGIFSYSATSSILPRPYYKVHTENGKCEINLDDYTLINGATNQYTIGGMGDASDPFLVAPASIVYSGL